MTIWGFMSEHCFLAFLIICSVYYVCEMVLFRLPNRIMRHANIRKHGYPPVHCDADGDFRPEKTEEKKA